MSSFVRIRLSFERPLSLAEVKNCWFLVDTSTCRTIADLEYLIKKRFGALSKVSGSSINLFLDDYLLPSQEKIEIIQQNDNIRYAFSRLSCTGIYVRFILFFRLSCFRLDLEGPGVFNRSSITIED